MLCKHQCVPLYVVCCVCVVCVLCVCELYGVVCVWGVTVLTFCIVRKSQEMTWGRLKYTEQVHNEFLSKWMSLIRWFKRSYECTLQ